MELKRLRVFSDTLKERVDSFPVEVVGVDVYYHHNDDWFPLESSTTSSTSSERQVFERVRKGPASVERPRASKFVYFWLTDRQAVVRLMFETSIKSTAQEKCKKTLDRLNGDADKFFHATHDSLTGLKNRSAFEQKLASAVVRQRRAISEMQPALAGKANSSLPSVSIFLIALDIDNFKTINDRFGHGYGDLVLASLGWRLERVAQLFERGGSGKYSAEAFRLGGEEFEVLVVGSLTEKEALEFAETIRAAVGTKAMPSHEEHEKLKARDFYDGSELRPESQRSVSVSIGVAMVTKDPFDTPAKKAPAVATLKRQADIALYSAKIGGKDRVRNFADILSLYGRVSEVDRVNGVVSIDIGKEVGVKNGQEFFVYAPNYDGSTDYFLGEGRSRKRVGVYPKYRVARIAVFNVQNEVAFCRVEEHEKGVVEIQAGSSLEAIPLGSIAHIVAKVDGGHHFLNRDAIAADLRGFNRGAVVISATLRRIEEVSEQLGMARANSLLGLVGQGIVSSVGRNGRFGQLAVGSIVAVRACETQEEAMRVAEETLRQVRAEIPQGVQVGVGWLFKPPGEAPTNMQGELRPDDIIDAAILASSLDAFQGGELHQFDENTLWLALFTSRMSAQHDRMTADYERFARISAPIHWIYNQMALMHAENDDIDLAVEFMKRAMSMEPVPALIKMNYGCMQVNAGKYDDALLAFDGIDVDNDVLPSLLFAKLRTDPDEFGRYVLDNAEVVGRLETHGVWLTAQQAAELRGRIEDALRR